ncbi:MAG: hypothetical protein A2722_00645 [Candidatus Doudnabacteria bacterium RIFCSPHIGHO2_01_FULL_50_11]|uniref:Glycosyl transferase family 1 domain-containing protein n=1 Tax=Candidatus Doudnabacteria bacterium RIFCSPHIGHO2_01_FULL_50_11 TaxID=1817828 RepID=A0A1F5PNQ1_9BACT|nr:MAG: hypothetical protein A2722_00645 [Candidatus Doudnabacteria bacterium RIFCSPHIGHO2_01_FULL_50_11]
MKICIITSSYPRSSTDSRNAGVFVLQFAEALQRSGCEVLVLTPDKYGEKDEHPQVPVKFFWTLKGETELVNLRPWWPPDLLQLIVLLVSGVWNSVRTLGSYKPDAVLACWVVPSGIFGLAGKIFCGVPYMTWALGSDIWKIRRYPLGPTILRVVLRRASHRYADGVGLSQIVSDYAGLPCDFLPSVRTLPPRASPAVRDPWRLVMISRFHPDKGPDLLIEAMSLVRKHFPQARLCLFGGGPMEAALKEQTARLGLGQIVEFGGYLQASGVADALAESAALVIPSRIESIPLVFSEGIQTQTPMIVTDVGDMGKLCRKHNFGLVAQPSAAGIAQKIMEFFQTSDRARLAAPDEAGRLFSPTGVASRFLVQIQTRAKI